MNERASGLPRDIRQTRPFKDRTQECVIDILHTSDVLRRLLTKVVEPHGITLQQYNVLRILRDAGEAGLPTLEIAQRMIEQTPGITRLLDRLERKVLVRRERRRQDRRQVLCWISQKGLKLLKSLDRPVGQAERTALGKLSGNEIETLIRLLDVVRASQ